MFAVLPPSAYIGPSDSDTSVPAGNVSECVTKCYENGCARATFKPQSGDCLMRMSAVPPTPVEYCSTLINHLSYFDETTTDVQFACVVCGEHADFISVAME